MIVVHSNADTEMLALRTILHRLPAGFSEVRTFSSFRAENAQLVVVRLLGGRSAWEEPFDQLRASCVDAGIAFIALGGEATPDPELARLSTVPAGIVAEAHTYFAAGGPDNIENVLRFLSDTVLLTGFGFDRPQPIPMSGVWEEGVRRRPGESHDSRLVVGVVFYRAHLIAGNTQFVADLCDALDAAGVDALPIYCYSLRVEGALEHATDVDALITCVLAAGSSDGEEGGWEVPELAGLGVPVLQAPTCNRPRHEWIDDEAGLSPLDVALGVAIPEFDGRIVGPAFAFKEEVDDGGRLGTPIVASRTDPERTRRVAGMAARLARLRHTPVADKRVAIVLSAYPTKRSRLGNAVGLDTPASTIRLLLALRDAGYRVGEIPPDGDTLMAELAARLSYEHPAVSAAQAAKAIGRLSADDYATWFDSLPAEAHDQVTGVWGEAPGDVYARDGQLVFPGIDFGNVIVTIQPPRGFGSDPIGTYHAPDVPPPHHYLAFYRWLTAADGWNADAVVHMGKHGTLEWLPGKANALSESCFPDAALGEVPFVYPFVVNDPGEGTQAKRRTHAVIVDHLVPPMTRADTYDDLARIEQLLDTYAQAQAMDPAKLPALRQQVWEVLVEAEIHRDLGLARAPDEDEFDEMILHVDGYLCALKDAQIRGGLHVLGAPPEGDAMVDLILGITRLRQGAIPSLRELVAADLDIDLSAGRRHDIDRVEATCRRFITEVAPRQDDSLAGNSGFQRGHVRAGVGSGRSVNISNFPEQFQEVGEWVRQTLLPALQRTPDEIGNILAALDGQYVPAGPSGAPTRGAAHVLPTGRNFYSVDPKAVPSRLSWDVGCRLADQLIERHIAETGSPPNTVGLVLWGTAAMRTGGDDAAQALALLGVRPCWEDESGRVTGLEVIPDEDLGRPRVDVTLRISGFFRDAFPHLISLLDEAVELVFGSGDARIWGPPPGGYGSGILPVLERGSWRNDADLADVYLAWSGFAYGRDRFGEADPEAMVRRFAAIEVAVKNQDNREHDIFDSDDYLQDHGGMVAAVRALTGKAPRAWFGDTSDPASPQVRSLAEEAARVVRSRVLNPRWITAMQRHGYKGAFELAATVDYLFGYDATAHVVEDWMYERVTDAYVGDPQLREFFGNVNPTALQSIAEKLLEADRRGMWQASEQARKTLVDAVLEAEGWEEAGT